MARKGVTFEEVARAAERVETAGEDPTIKRVREELGGTGSPNTIHRHLAAWKADKPQARKEAPSLPADLQAALVKELTRQADAAQLEARKEAEAAQRIADDLALEGERLEGDIDELNGVVAAARKERDQALALAEERDAEIRRLHSELAQERQVAFDARSEVESFRYRENAIVEQVASLKAQLADTHQKLEDERAARVKAEQADAVKDARLVASAEKIEDLEEEIASLKAQLSDALKLAEKERESLEKARKEAWDQSQQAASWREQFHVEHEATRSAVAKSEELEEEVAQLKATLAEKKRGS